MVDNALFDEIKSVIKYRQTWEDRQAVWYRMRYEGIKRAKKPYKNAPDMHYPLVDTMIEKMKPFYIAQLYGQQRLATFVSRKQQDADLTNIAEQLFDYTLKERSNFERSIYTAIDFMLMYGRGPLKIYWDVDADRLAFSAIRPIYIITPSWTEDLGNADWVVHVMHMSEAAYRANPEFLQDDDLIKTIKGRGNETGGTVTQQQDLLRREGITMGAYQDQIVLWEVYSRDAGKIMVDTMSPMAGPGQPIRKQFQLPYRHNQFPFADLRYELAEEDYYAPRGVTEILSQFELDLCKLWNHKLQFLDYFGQPNFKNSGSIGNSQNWQNAPGKILPEGLEPIQAIEAPIGFKEDMELQRALAEDRIQIPDLSADSHLAGTRGAKGEVTATQINAIVGQASGSNDMRARIFRLQTARAYLQGWSLVCQYIPQEEQILSDFQEVPDEALHTEYRIAPSGSADSYNKEQRLGKALAYYQTLITNPYIKGDELTKWTLEQDNSELVQRFFQSPVDATQDEQERQGQEIVLMLNKFAAKVHPRDDDKTHLITMAQWVQHRLQPTTQVVDGRMVTAPLGIDPEMAAQLLQHGQAHGQQIMQKKDKQGKLVVQNMKPIADMLAQIAQSGAPAQGANGAQPQLPGMAGAGANGQQKDSEAINYKDAPPDIQRQMEARYGYRPSQIPPEQVAALKTPPKSGNSNGAPPRQAASAPQVAPGSPSVHHIPVEVHVPPAAPPPAPVVHVPAPIVHVHPEPRPAPMVNVPAPIVHVPAPVVHVEAPKSKKRKVTLRRDKDGHMTGADVEEIE